MPSHTSGYLRAGEPSDGSSGALRITWLDVALAADGAESSQLMREWRLGWAIKHSGYGSVRAEESITSLTCLLLYGGA
jgi:hypothetical protein